MLIKEEFPDKKLFLVISVAKRTPSFDDIANYLFRVWLPQDMCYEPKEDSEWR